MTPATTLAVRVGDCRGQPICGRHPGRGPLSQTPHAQCRARRARIRRGADGLRAVMGRERDAQGLAAAAAIGRSHAGCVSDAAGCDQGASTREDHRLMQSPLGPPVFFVGTRLPRPRRRACRMLRPCAEISIGPARHAPRGGGSPRHRRGAPLSRSFSPTRRSCAAARLPVWNTGRWLRSLPRTESGGRFFRRGTSRAIRMTQTSSSSTGQRHWLTATCRCRRFSPSPAKVTWNVEESKKKSIGATLK